jgi:hypothetical protein
MMNRVSLLIIASFLSTAYSFSVGSKSIGLISSNHVNQQWSGLLHHRRNQIQNLFSNINTSRHIHPKEQQQQHEDRIATMIRQEWIQNSVQYYSKVMREERRRSIGQYKEYANYNVLAKKHYFALKKIKDGKPDHAECIYRRIINELVHELRQEQVTQDHCDHSTLAITTLLLALHLQRNEASPKKTRSVFLNFFRIVTSDGHTDANEECACSAKVLQAFALFEMKQGNALKSLELAKAAIKLDPSLKSVLNWKQFRDATARRMERQQKQQQNQI